MELNEVLRQLNWIDQVAGIVWIGLTILLLVTLFGLRKKNELSKQNVRWGLLLLVFIWMYPLYTLGFSSLILGEIGNIATLLLTLFVWTRIRRQSIPLSRLLIPQCIWLVVATAYVGLQLVAI